MNNRAGHRGYIGSRPYAGGRVPQHVQNLVIRDYCRRNDLHYLLSATEYAMPGCYMVLEEVAAEASQLGGIVLYSIFMLPRRRERRMEICRRIFDAGATVYGAVENIVVADEDGLMRIDEILMLSELVQNVGAANALSALTAFECQSN